ncbi:hypothetical protein F-M6_0030 [Faustovirus]|nr:hypothetical protein F-M6_0030 [Faustovirus]QJX73804.1 hypothetical protein F-E9_31 [Faustovirus]
MILPRDLLVEIAMFDWRVYGAMSCCDRALNARLRVQPRATVANYEHIVVDSERHFNVVAAGYLHGLDLFAKYYRVILVNTADMRVYVYRGGALRRSVEYAVGLDGDLYHICEIKRYTICDDGVKYRECVDFEHDKPAVMQRRRKHPRGYVLQDTYIEFTHALRFDDYYMTRHTSTRYELANDGDWRITGEWFIYNYVYNDTAMISQ